MNTFTRFTAALGLAAIFGATAVFAQATPPVKGTPVKGYTKTLKSGKKVAVKGYTRKPMAMKPKMTAVKGYTKTLKSGKKVAVKGYTRKTTMTPKKTTMTPKKVIKPMSKPGGTM